LEEAITITTDQESWKTPSIKLNPSKLCKICGNLVNFDEPNGTVSLAHHTVLSFLLRCSEIPSVTNFHIEGYEAERYLAEICITYLNFVNFKKSLIPTTDTRNLQHLNRPVNLLTPMLPRPLSAAFQGFSNRRWRENKRFDLTNAVRTEISAYHSGRMDLSF
jgi:hypothetical protein